MSSEGKRIIECTRFIMASGRAKSWSQAMRLAALALQKEKKTGC